MRAAALLALAALAAGAPAHAEKPHVASVSVGEPATARAGTRTTLKVSVTVKPGYHVQANPVLNPALIPVQLTVAGTPAVEAGKPVYPQARRLRLLGSDEDLVVYDGTFVIEQPVSVRKGSAPGEVVLRGSLRYQACDDRHCLLPRTLPVELRLRIAES